MILLKGLVFPCLANLLVLLLSPLVLWPCVTLPTISPCHILPVSESPPLLPPFLYPSFVPGTEHNDSLFVLLIPILICHFPLL